MNKGFEYVFPAIRGIQAQREYYVSMCPMRLLPKLFIFDEEELVPELRAQRHLNKARLPELSRYITDNPDDYVFSAITVSIDAAVTFEQLPMEEDAGSVSVYCASRCRLASLSMMASIVARRSTRRCAKSRSWATRASQSCFSSISGLARCQQMFADLNRHAIRPSKSLGILYDYRDETALLAKALIADSPIFRDFVELEKDESG